MAKIGIVGGAGFVGSHIANALRKSGYEVTIYDIVDPRVEGTKFVRKDITKDSLDDLGENDVIIHAAIIQIPKINQVPDLAYRVNMIGTQRVCEVCMKSPKTVGFILTGSWHVYGEFIEGTITEDYGYNPEKTDERARLYAYSKVGQEVIVKFFGAMTKGKKSYIVIRMGTVLGEGMPEKTAANIFINNAINGKPITPYKHSMYRPMLYVDIQDVCGLYIRVIEKMLSNEPLKYDVFHIFYPEPITILGLAEIVKKNVEELTNNKIRPAIEIVDKNMPILYPKEMVSKIRGDISRIKEVFKIEKVQHPSATIRRLIEQKLSKMH